jgi:hypothetical protein
MVAPSSPANDRNAASGSAPSASEIFARQKPATPAGGVATPPHDPPAASPTPGRGQAETTAAAEAAARAERGGFRFDADAERAYWRERFPELPYADAARADYEQFGSAFEFGWENFLARHAATGAPRVSFEHSEQELEAQWRQRGPSSPAAPLPWQQAREAARDAWNHVQDALAGVEPPAPGGR